MTLPQAVQGRDEKLVRLLNQMLAAVRAQRVVASPDVLPRESASGTALALRPDGAAADVFPVVVKEERASTLVCERLALGVQYVASTPPTAIPTDQLQAIGEVVVLKPHHLWGVGTAEPAYPLAATGGVQFGLARSCIFVTRLAVPFPIDDGVGVQYVGHLDLNVHARRTAPISS